ncbi:M23 family metallopeptidase [Urechidicola sp. KH5]
MKNTFFYILLFFITSGFSQTNYPKDYFQYPLDIPIYLSGTFGELRSNHFHSGLDMKTQQKEGLKVFAAAEGYVSRIKISHWGYGKAIYVTHPNGYTTVYAHLKKFNPTIEAYIKKQQYIKETYEIQLYPKETELLIEKGEVIAYSGSTGGFVGPHLHFEIRDKQSRPINPMHFGISVKDTKRPSINVLMAYPQNDSTQVNGSNAPIQLNFKAMADGNLIADKIEANGTIGLGIFSFDRQDGALNKNGVYSVDMFANGQKIIGRTADIFSFAESKLINLLIDYPRYADINQRIQRCFIVPRNELSIYNNVVNEGYIHIEEGKNYNIEIIVKDFSGNVKKMIVPIEGKTQEITVPKENVTPTPYFVNSELGGTFKNGGIEVKIPKKAFYEDVYLDLEIKDTIVEISKQKLPMHANYSLSMDVSNYSEKAKEKLFIASINSKGYLIYMNTKKKGNTFSTSTKNLGQFTLASDTKKPSLRLHNFKDKQWMTYYNQLILKVSDDLSGLKSYRGEIDGEWILLEYSPKHGTLTYDFTDKKFDTAKHTLKVMVEDQVGNTNEIEATFYRKK